MARITILGAGFMGSALTFPATDNGHEVRLWGTWLEALHRIVYRGADVERELRRALFDRPGERPA